MPQDQQFGDAFGFDDVAVDLAVDLKTADAAQNCAPVVEVVFLVFVHRGAKKLALRLFAALQRVKLHIHQTCGVVRSLQKSAQAHEVQGFVHQHGANGDAA